ncbi:beta-galactosidase [Haloferula helveola]|uniref:Beta-galactosidase n=1 Tax=Haloferula helveola TaxID=490095 RepID=A0ABN6H0I7_9BACT|nr:beta-galactosidase [Haloferula helveola]
MKVLPYLLLLTLPVLAQPDAPVWENQAIFRINKEAPRATSVPYPERAELLKKKPEPTPWVQSLNDRSGALPSGGESIEGEWKFHYAGTPSAVPEGFEKPGFDISAWPSIPVPSNWQLHGYGVPLYTNSEYPFKADPPRVMGTPPGHFTNFPEDERNPVGCYRRNFTVPKDWEDRETFIVFNGVDSAFHLWINGEHVGYSQDSRTPAEFNIGKFLKSGENTLAVQVFQYSDGSYLEDQDMWRLSGIFRDVYLWSSASLQVRDIWVKAGLADDYRTGTLEVEVEVRDLSGEQPAGSVEFELLGSDGKTIASASSKLSGGTLSLKPDRLPDIEPWSAEIPKLYAYLLTLKNADGEVLAIHPGQTGFRRNEVKDGNFLHNGKPILFKGVNRHDHNPRTGHYVTPQDMIADLLEMKRSNINAVRCSHYPNEPIFLELCDRLGFYVIDEANVETHGMGWGPDANPLAKDPSWGPAHLDRMKNCLERDKNHPCVVMWSMGNEAGDGVNFQEMSKWIRERDPSRPVHYEQARQRPHVDVFAPMYAPVTESLRYAKEEAKKPLNEQRPMIQCEYNHAMGNSSGNLAEYWEAFRSERLLQGGFIWDWKDQGLFSIKHAYDAVEDRSGNGHKTALLGSLSTDEGLYGGGLTASDSAKLGLTESVTLHVEARGNFGGARSQGGGDNNRNASDGYPLLTKGDTAYSLKIDPSGSNLEFFVYTDNWQTLRAPLPENWRSEFHDLVGTYDGAKMTIRIDGKEVASKPTSGRINVNGFDLGVGLNTEKPTRRFDGSIRRARVYAKALGPSADPAKQPAPVIDLRFTEDAAKKKTRPFYAYGGDFNDRPSQRSFCLNGIMMPNLTRNPHHAEVWKVHQEIHTSMIDDSSPNLQVKILNERFFRPLDDVSALWVLLKDEEMAASGKLELPPVEPQSTHEVTIPTGVKPTDDSAWTLQIRFVRTTATMGVPKGGTIALDEHKLPWGKRTPPEALPSEGEITFKDGDDGITIAGERFEAAVDRSTGMLESWKTGATQQLASPMQLDFWRPMTNNDEGAGYPSRLSAWSEAGAKASATSVAAEMRDNACVVKSDIEVPVGNSTATLVWKFLPSGQVEVEATFRPSGGNLPIIPRVGLRAGIPSTNIDCHWFGAGPGENYEDRHTGAWTGVHSRPVSGFFHNYLDPQEAGLRTGVRWLEITPRFKGTGLRVDALGEQLLQMAVLPCDPLQLELARHSVDVLPGDIYTIRIDCRNMGVGGTNSWGQQPLEKYRIKPEGEFRWSFRLSSQEADPTRHGRGIYRKPPGFESTDPSATEEPSSEEN